MTRLDDLCLTSQELTYLATGARFLAMQAHADAGCQQTPSVRALFEDAERVYLALAAKVDRLAELARGCPAADRDGSAPDGAPGRHG